MALLKYDEVYDEDGNVRLVDVNGHKEFPPKVTDELQQLAEIVCNNHYGYVSHHNRQDLILEGLAKGIELIKSCRFDPEYGAPLKNFIYTGMRNEMHNYLYSKKREYPVEEFYGDQNIARNTNFKEIEVDFSILAEITERFKKRYGDYSISLIRRLEDMGIDVKFNEQWPIEKLEKDINKQEDKREKLKEKQEEIKDKRERIKYINKCYNKQKQLEDSERLERLKINLEELDEIDKIPAFVKLPECNKEIDKTIDFEDLPEYIEEIEEDIVDLNTEVKHLRKELDEIKYSSQHKSSIEDRIKEHIDADEDNINEKLLDRMTILAIWKIKEACL